MPRGMVMYSSNPVQYPGHSDDSAGLTSIEALAALVAADARPGGVVRVATGEACGRVLAEAVQANADYPPFDKAMMDGYAVRAADAATAPVELVVVEERAAGDDRPARLAAGQALRINTGAPMPEGADAVVMIERTAPTRDASRVRIMAAAKPGQNVAPRGGVCRLGEAVLSPPMRLGPAQIAAAAAAGSGEVVVYARPRLALASTGDELAPAGAARSFSQIYDSNGPSLTALGRLLGADVTFMGCIRDEEAALRERMIQALDAEIVVTIGGMAMGTRDLVPCVLRSLGVTWKVHGVNMRPGRPIGYGVGPRGQLVFGLPGNPVSCFVGFLLFVHMAIDGLSGLAARLPRGIRARLTRPTKAVRDPRPAFEPARLTWASDGTAVVEPAAWGGSGDPFGLGRANALLVRPEGGAAQAEGTLMDVLPIDAIWFGP